jgi:hypothetical protein
LIGPRYKSQGVAQQELNNLVLRKESEKKNIEDQYLSEENNLKETVKAESEKRDIEQKIFIQEKTAKERELQRLKDDYERRRHHWDSQIKTLTMQKSVLHKTAGVNVAKEKY